MNVYVLNTLGIGLDSISLINSQLKISGVIGLSDREGTDQISDFSYQAGFCKQKGIDFIEVDSYGLTKESDRKKLLALKMDVLIVSGWQRLIPEWLIQHCSICAIGAHGSPLGITKGRGRSPQNWALMLGLNTFHISIFKIDSNIDSGEIIDTRSFTYSPFDDIKTSYYKVCLLTAGMIIDNLRKPDFAKQNFEAQNDEDAEYFPQRTPEDGLIDWTRSNDEIRNFVRALTRPYPGAETFIEGQKIKIWSLIPFEVDFPNADPIGTIVKIFNKNDLLVKTKESFVLITDYKIESKEFFLKEKMQFGSESFEKQMNTIVKRHEAKYPELPVSKQILEKGTG
jgi:methionyl-tRNA formyltransferase